MTKSHRQKLMTWPAIAAAFFLVAPSPAFAQPEKAKPPMAGAFPSLPGTAWKIESPGSIGVMVFRFCKKTTDWQVVPSQPGHFGPSGPSFIVSGGTLTTTASDGKVEKYKMTWKDGVLELNDGKAILRLRYNGEVSC